MPSFRLYQRLPRPSSSIVGQVKGQQPPNDRKLSPLTSRMALLQAATIESCRPMMETLQGRFPRNQTLAEIQSLYTEPTHLTTFHHHGALALKLGQLATGHKFPGFSDDPSLIGDHLTLARTLSLLNLGLKLHSRIQTHPSTADHLSTKLLTLFGDYVNTLAMPLVASSSQSVALLDLSASVTKNLSEGFYSLTVPDASVPNGAVAGWKSLHYKLNVQQFALGCRCALELASVSSDGHLKAAFDFGRNYGYAFVARIEEECGESDLPIGTLQRVRKKYLKKAIQSAERLPVNEDAKDRLVRLLLL